jgi:hypothetical protein
MEIRNLSNLFRENLRRRVRVTPDPQGIVRFALTSPMVADSPRGALLDF